MYATHVVINYTAIAQHVLRETQEMIFFRRPSISLIIKATSVAIDQRTRRGDVNNAGQLFQAGRSASGREITSNYRVILPLRLLPGSRGNESASYNFSIRRALSPETP